MVGTIHSLCLRLADVDPKNLVDSKKIREWNGKLENAKVPSLEWMETWAMDEPTRNAQDVEVALWCRAAALHRMIPLDDVWPLVDPNIAAQMSFPAIRRLVESYETWKKARGYFDFENLLMLGRDLRPPVKVVLADECQDNSPLLYSVINSWGTSPDVALFVCVGDAYQALYGWAGGDPGLFSNRPGTWHTLPKSYRLSTPAVEYAKNLLRSAFGGDKRFDDLTNWTGVAGTGPKDPSSFWLARTNALVGIKAAQLQQDGEPYAFIRGRAPLQTKAADAYRSILRAEAGNLISRDDLLAIAQQFTTSTAKKAAAYIRTLPQGWYGSGTIETACGVPPRALLAQLPYSQYFARLRARFGDDVIFQRPSLSLGTIHSAKGKECGTTTLCINWATKPYANMRSVEGRRAETCAAYVGSSRHRNLLVLESLQGASGGVYPFPPVRRERDRSGGTVLVES